MLYEYPDEFIVPITYIKASIDNTEQKNMKNDEHISQKDKIMKCIDKNEKRISRSDGKNTKKHKLKRNYRDKENDDDILDHLIEENLITSNQKECYIEDSDMYSDIDDEYVKEEIKNKK
ncbi:MAG: hypothetical protein Q4F66_03505 [Clostridium sp.]|nr:hypothetical protein [Clostridium sp.]